MLHASQTLPGRLLGLLLILMIALTAGCGWFGGNKRKVAAYELAPEARPLELPPDLDMPMANPEMVIPVVPPGPVGTGPAPPIRGVGTPAAAAAAGVTIAGVTDFTLEDSKANAFRRIGLALGRVEGVHTASSSELLGTFEVQYLGQDFLIRIEEAEVGVRVDAVTTDGREISTGPASQLLAQLKQRLS